jgi:hypothetical protein
MKKIGKYLHDEEEENNEGLSDCTVGTDKDCDEDQSYLAVHDNDLPEIKLFSVTSVKETVLFSCF